MHLSPFLIISTIAALAAADSCPSGFSIMCCNTFATQPSNPSYLQGINCKSFPLSPLLPLSSKTKLTSDQVIQLIPKPPAGLVRPIDSAA